MFLWAIGRYAPDAVLMRLLLLPLAASLLWIEAASAQVESAKPGDQGSTVMTQPGFQGLHVMHGTPDYVTTRLGRVHYWSFGKGPVLILLHQGPLFSVEFAKIQPLLAEQGFRTIAVDLPGFGFSQRPDHPATGPEYADSIATLLDHLGVKRAAVAGTHTGATVALAFAVTHPERISCLVMQSVPVYSTDELKDRLNAPPPDTRIYQDGRQIQAWWKMMTTKYDFTHGSPESLQWLLVGTLLTGDSNWFGDNTGWTFVTRSFDSAAALPKVKAPTLMISVAGDQLEDSVQRALQIRPDFAHVGISDHHGIITIDDPQLWARTVGGFVTEQCPQSAPRAR